MAWLFVAVAAQLILGSASVFDRFLLKKRAIEAWPYAFWLGVLGVFAALLLPFGYEAAPFYTILLAIFAGMLFFGAVFFEFRALEKSEVSEALPLIGTISPVATLWFANIFLGISLGLADIIGFVFLIGGGLVIFLAEKGELKSDLLMSATAASFLLAGSFIASKIVFSQTSFITAFFWIKIGGAALAVMLLAFGGLRKKILRSAKRSTPKNKKLYFANRAYAAVGSMLVSGAIFLANPALVNSTQNFRYVVIFILAWLVLHERFRGRVLGAKITAVVLVVIGLGWLAAGEYIRSLPAVDTNRPIHWGVTFSAKFSRELGLNWKENFTSVLDDLNPERLRLIAYWNDIEKEKGRLDFSDLDWQLGEAFSRNKKVILVLGLKTPRWPECHAPQWTRKLGQEEREEALRHYVSKVVDRYRGHPAIFMWQVENEPYLLFGECTSRGDDFLQREIQVVRSLDSKRPILTTDGGEFGLWALAASYGDVFGTTMYRKVYPRFIGPIFGVIEYPIRPSYFRLKERLIKAINDTPNQHFIVSELQGEPWSPTSLRLAPYPWQVRSFSPEYFRDTIAYAREAGFDEYYLWGAEWWYWMKTEHGDERYWNIAKEVFNAEKK